MWMDRGGVDRGFVGGLDMRLVGGGQRLCRWPTKAS